MAGCILDGLAAQPTRRIAIKASRACFMVFLLLCFCFALRRNGAGPCIFDTRKGEKETPLIRPNAGGYP